jgi:hypothetical protein
VPTYQLSGLTDNQLTRAYCRVWSHIERAYAGGTSFGIDRPTLYACLPSWATLWEQLRSEMQRRMREQQAMELDNPNGPLATTFDN